MQISLRPVNGAADAENILRIDEDSKGIDGIDPLSTLEHIPTLAEFAEQLGGLNPANGQIAERDGKVVGYALLMEWQEEDVYVYLHLGRVHPKHREQGVGTLLLQWAEDRIRQLAIEQPKATPPVFAANAASTEGSATQLLIDNAYHTEWIGALLRFDAFDTLSDIVLPDGFEIRPAVAADAPFLYRTLREVWGNAWGLPVETNESYREFVEQVGREGHHWRALWHGDVVVGQVWARRSGNIGIIDEMDVLPDYRRRGFASALMTAALRLMREHGADEVRLHTNDADVTGAKSMYLKMGFQQMDKTYPRYRKAF